MSLHSSRKEALPRWLQKNTIAAVRRTSLCRWVVSIVVKVGQCLSYLRSCLQEYAGSDNHWIEFLNELKLWARRYNFVFLFLRMYILLVAKEIDIQLLQPLSLSHSLALSLPHSLSLSLVPRMTHSARMLLRHNYCRHHTTRMPSTIGSVHTSSHTHSTHAHRWLLPYLCLAWHCLLTAWKGQPWNVFRRILAPEDFLRTLCTTFLDRVKPH